MVLHTCKPSTQEVDAEGSGVQGYSRVHREFRASLGYIRSYSQNHCFITVFFHKIKKNHYFEESFFKKDLLVCMCVYTYVGAQGGQKKVLRGEAIVSCMMQALRSVPFKSSTGSWLLLHLSSPINYFLSSIEHHFYQLFFFLKLSCRV